MPSSIVYTIKGGDAVVFPKSSIKHSRQDAYIGMAPTRHCTDVFFLVAIVAMWSAMSIVGALAIRTGNPFRLVAPMNDQGQLCGPYASSGIDRQVPLLFLHALLSHTLLTTNPLSDSHHSPTHISLSLVIPLYPSFCVVRIIG